jgi:hypothetical protein
MNPEFILHVIFPIICVIAILLLGIKAYLYIREGDKEANDYLNELSVEKEELARVNADFVDITIRVTSRDIKDAGGIENIKHNMLDGIKEHQKFIYISGGRKIPNPDYRE